MEIKKGDKVIINDTLGDKLTELGIMCDIEGMESEFVGTTQVAHAIWEDDGQQYVTIDLCIEIPIECCEVFNGNSKEEKEETD